MRCLAITLLVLTGCPQKPEKTAKGPPPIPKRVAVSWGQEQHGESTEVFLQLTDETGKQFSYPVGTYPGVCSIAQPAPQMNAAIGMGCFGKNTHTELHAVVQKDEIIVLRLKLDGGVAPDPMNREEVTRVKAPGGAAIQIGT
jgi:hypothetical protein